LLCAPNEGEKLKNAKNTSKVAPGAATSYKPVGAKKTKVEAQTAMKDNMDSTVTDTRRLMKLTPHKSLAYFLDVSNGAKVAKRRHEKHVAMVAGCRAMPTILRGEGGG
jgi:hypothetical protein